MDGSVGQQMPGRRSHHAGPFDPSLASRNYYQGKQGTAPMDAVQYTNQQALEATPQGAVYDSLRSHVPLQGTAGMGVAMGNGYDGSQSPGGSSGYGMHHEGPAYPPQPQQTYERRPIQLGSDDGSNSSYDSPNAAAAAASANASAATPKRTSLGQRMKNRMSLRKSS